MSEQKWRAVDFGRVVNTENETIATAKNAEDARRIVACVNACVGVSTESLELPEGFELAKSGGFIIVRDKRSQLSSAVPNTHTDKVFYSFLDKMLKAKEG